MVTAENQNPLMQGNTQTSKLAKSQRLSKPDDFKRIYKSKHWGSNLLFSFNALPSKKPKIGVTVSKKVSKLAVDRNRIKRQIKEYYRLHQCEIKPAEIVITARPACYKASATQRVQALEELFLKIKKWQRWLARAEEDNTVAHHPTPLKEITN